MPDTAPPALRRGAPGGAQARPEAPPLGYPGATAALAAVTVVSALAFSRVFTTSGWVLPTLVIAAGSHALCWWLRSRRVASGAALLLVVAAVGLAGCYLVLPRDLSGGLPLGQMYQGVSGALAQAGRGMRHDLTPLPAAPGYSLLVAWGAGLAALSADTLAFRLRAPLYALGPPFAVFLTASAIGTARGRAWTVGAEVAVMAAFLLAERLSAGREGLAWVGGRRAAARRSAASIGALGAAAAVVAAVALTPAVSAREGDGILGWRQPNGPATRITPSPFDDLRTRLLDNPDTVVMTVSSTEPSYWRLTSLDDFNGTVWSSDDSYQGANGRLRGTQEKPGTRQVNEVFHVDALDSIWLPTGFNPEAVQGIGDVSWDPGSGSLISPSATSNGETYWVQASEQLAQLSSTALASVPPLTASSPPAADLSLPGGIPARVAKLAHTITAEDHTEYAKAYALEQYFHQAPFSYSTDPASDDSSNALATFLFTTHQGYCQQFAGAYAVLAREAGLPTRIAVGFQTGTLNGGAYTVTDADAHAWPEVWFPTVGWVPFEPTPGRQVPDATYTGDTEGPLAAPAGAAPPTSTPAASELPQAARPGGTKLVPAPAPPPEPARHTGGGTGALAALAAGLAAILAGGWIGAMVLLRRVRWRLRRRRAGRPAGSRRAASWPRGWRRHQPAPGTTGRRRIAVAWAETAEALAGCQLRRHPDETVAEFASRAGHHLHTSAGRGTLDGQLAELAALVQEAEFSSRDPGPPAAERAERLAACAAGSIRHAASRSRRLEHLVDPRFALHPATLEPREPAART